MGKFTVKVFSSKAAKPQLVSIPSEAAVPEVFSNIFDERIIF